MNSLDPETVSFVREAAGSAAYRAHLRDVLVELVRLNTAADSDPAATAARERAFFSRLEQMIREAAGDGIEIERQAIPAAIGNDPDYSVPGYAVPASGETPSPEQIYRDRGNLIAIVDGTDGSTAPRARPVASPSASSGSRAESRDATGSDSSGVILHAHVDVVPPWFDAREQGGRVYGRGACDNKAQVAVLLAQMKLMRELGTKFPALRAGKRVYQFTIDEEAGGNGSVAAALDARFKGLPVLMHESTDLTPYCAHRGCVYYRCELSIGANAEITALELYPFVVLALEAEGRKIQRETNYPGFSATHVQTNHGVLGPYGQHAGNVCDHVAIDVVAFTNAHPDRLAMKLTQYLDEALVEYFNRYGDKSKERDAAGEPKVARHFEVKVLPSEEGQRVRVDVYGKSGHMAAVRECDNAITKAALLFGSLLKNAAKFPNIQAYGRFSDAPEGDDAERIVLEGGQGFTPSHTMEQIKKRVREAATEAVQKYCKLRGRRFDPGMVKMTFERLHNDAYADSPECAPMRALLGACSAAGQPVGELKAWETSCDARIYHHKGHAVAIFGAGKLEAAHSDAEYVDLDDLQKALAISTLATLQLATDRESS